MTAELENLFASAFVALAVVATVAGLVSAVVVPPMFFWWLFFGGAA